MRIAWDRKNGCVTGYNPAHKIAFKSGSLFVCITGIPRIEKSSVVPNLCKRKKEVGAHASENRKSAWLACGSSTLSHLPKEVSVWW